MSSDSCAYIVYGIPLNKAKFITGEWEEFYKNGDETDDVGRFSSYDAQEFEDQLIGVKLNRVDWGYEEFDVARIVFESSETEEKLSEVISNLEDCRLYLVSSYF